MKRILLVASTTGYQVREFYDAARTLGVELVLATDRCHVLDNPWGDDAASVRFEDPSPGVAALQARGPFDGVIAVGDTPAKVAAEAAELFGLPFHPVEAVRAAADKFTARQMFRAEHLFVPNYRVVALTANPQAEALATSYPCVLKPLHLSASRGVIRADSRPQFEAAFERIRAMLQPLREEFLLVEDFIPGREFAIEGVMTAGKFQVLALFDKPDPLDGPFFEETIYITPSRVPIELQRQIFATVQKAVHALGLYHGPVHAEVRVNQRGVWMLEAAARPIGGLCSRVLKFRTNGTDESVPTAEASFNPKNECSGARKGCGAPLPKVEETSHAALRLAQVSPEVRLSPIWSPICGLEELLLRHALGQDVSHASLSPSAHGVMMIPIPRSGVYPGMYPGMYRGCEGVEEARAIPGIDDVVITAKEGQMLLPLPEGSAYLGFLFARGCTPDDVDKALRRAHAALRFRISEALPVVR